MFFVYLSRTTITSAAASGAARSLCYALTKCLLSRLDSTITQNCSSTVDLNSYQFVTRPGDPMQVQHVRIGIDAKLDFQIVNAVETRDCVAAKLRSMRFFVNEMFGSVDTMYPDESDPIVVWWFALSVVCMMLLVCIDKWDKLIRNEKTLLEMARISKTTPMKSKPRVQVPATVEETTALTAESNSAEPQTAPLDSRSI